MSLRHWFGFLLPGLLVLTLSAPVFAEPIQFYFTGAVVATNKPGTFPIGQPVVGFYTFESTTPDDNPYNPEQGYYFGALIDFTFASGSYAATATEQTSVNFGGDIIVNRNSGYQPHQYQVWLGHRDFRDPWGPTVNGEELWRMVIVLEDASQTAITSKALPLTPPDLAKFNLKTFNLIFETDPTSTPGGVVFELQTLVVVPTPTAPITWGRVKSLYSGAR